MHLDNISIYIYIYIYIYIHTHTHNLMETQTRLSRHNKFILAENIIAILSVSSDDSLHAFLLLQSSECGVSVLIQKIK